MLSLNCKNVQHVEIYSPCNFKVNPITHFGVIALFSSNFLNLIVFVLYFKSYKRQMLSLKILCYQYIVFKTFDEKKGNNSKMGNGIYFKIAGQEDLDMVQIFAIKLNLYLLQFLKYQTKSIKIKVCPQKRMSPSIPQTVVKGKKIYLGNK